MSALRREGQRIIALAVSDLHLTHEAPPARSEADSWYEVMEAHLGELIMISNELCVPILIAGDLFDRWNPPVELVNFAIRMFKHADCTPLAIPGQHDLRNHELDSLMHTAFGTLVASEAIEYLEPEKAFPLDEGIFVQGFPWGCDLHPIVRRAKMNIAVIHKYVWKDDKSSYSGAPKENHVRQTQRWLEGFDFIFSGDNHKQFLSDNEYLYNCGCFMRRISDEKDLTPKIAVLYDDEFIDAITMQAPERDKWNSPNELKAILKKGISEVDLEKLIEELNTLGETGISFLHQVKRFLKDTALRDAVREAIVETIGDVLE